MLASRVVTIELDGYFFLPGLPDKDVGGKLIFHPVDGGELSLLGSLSLPEKPTRILGRCSDGYYTLEDCFERSSSVSGEITTQRIYVGRIYGGVWYEEDEVPVFDQVNFGLLPLIEWVQPPRIEEELDLGPEIDETQKRGLLTLKTWKQQKIEIDSGTLKLGQSSGFNGDGLRERTLTQDLSFSWTFRSDLSTADAVDLTSDLQDLVTIGSCRVAAYRFLHLYHRDLGQELPSGARAKEAVRLLVPWLAQEESKRKAPHPSTMAFTFDDIGGLAGVAKWLVAAERYRSMLGSVMNTRYVKLLVDARFSFRVAALHGLHRTWKGGEREFKVALRQLADLVGEPFVRLVSDPEAWFVKATRERNNLAHHYGRQIHQSSTELFYSCEVAYWLFVLSMMRLADFPDAAFDRLVGCPDFTWLASKAPGMLQ
jgi:hypothetical protein